MLNEKATELEMERERLRAEQRKLNEQLTPVADYVTALPLRQVLTDFSSLAKAVEPGRIAEADANDDPPRWNGGRTARTRWNFMRCPQSKNPYHKVIGIRAFLTRQAATGEKDMYGLADPTGFEPAVSSVTGRRDNRYTTGPFEQTTTLLPASSRAFGNARKAMRKEGLEPPIACL